ncbi:hypothetical protein HZH68_014890 [Vespula germanica]|uniref:Uncharacterized protein n=1 Tax=Vespula germanica TaxID=30212 RepID=A0A834JCI2_VESGE|nr:hypothetical protein HZH68_014890 [Vespula germanica]
MTPFFSHDQRIYVYRVSRQRWNDETNYPDYIPDDGESRKLKSKNNARILERSEETKYTVVIRGIGEGRTYRRVITFEIETKGHPGRFTGLEMPVVDPEEGEGTALDRGG